MTQDRTPVQIKTEAIVAKCGANEHALLLRTAYIKRIRPVPVTTIKRAVGRFQWLAHRAKVQFDTPAEASQVMNAVCGTLWERLDAKQQRGWLLKVK